MPAFSGLSGAGWAINSSEYFEIPTFKRWREILREVAVSRARSKNTPSMGKGLGDWGLVFQARDGVQLTGAGGGGQS